MSATQTPTAPSKQESSKTVMEAFDRIRKLDVPTLVKWASPGIQDNLIPDAIRWAGDDPILLANLLDEELFIKKEGSKEVTINPKYLRFAQYIEAQALRYTRENPHAIAVVVLRMAASRILYKKATT